MGQLFLDNTYVNILAKTCRCEILMMLKHQYGEMSNLKDMFFHIEIPSK